MFHLFRRAAAPPQAASDPERIRSIAQGDRDALAALYRDYQPRLARFLSRHTRQEGLIEEVVNDTFWVVWQQARNFRGEARVSTWIMGIAYRLALKAFRDQDDLSRHDNDDQLADLLCSDPGEERELRDWVGKGMRLLAAEQRTTVELVYGQGYTLEETAAIMDCPVGTAKARLFHARVRLRNLLPDLAGEPPLAAAENGSST